MILTGYVSAEKAFKRRQFMKIDTIELKIGGSDSIFTPHIRAGSELVLVDAGSPRYDGANRGLFA